MVKKTQGMYFQIDLKGLFGCTCIRLNPCVLKWIVMKIKLSYSPIHSNTHVFKRRKQKETQKASLVASQFLPSQNIDKLQRFGMHLV